MSKITLAQFFSAEQRCLIECHSREQSDAVRRAFHAFGKTWQSGDSFLELDYWRSGDEYLHYSNDCCQGKHRPSGNEWVIYDFDDVAELSGTPVPEPDPHQFRILLRKDYRWHDASWDSKKNRISVGRNNYSETEIVSVENDPRTKYVKCSACGDFIKNTKKEIEAHAAMSKSSEACLHCNNLYVEEKDTIKESFVKNEDGTYTKTKKTACQLLCGYSYGSHQIDTDKARSHCRYRNCNANTIAKIDNVFLNYPGVFDDIAMVDALDTSKWEIYTRHSNDHITFKLKSRYNILVYTTNLGIVDRFICSYRSNNHEIMYSKKYDKMFELCYGEYHELTTSDMPFSETYYNELLKIMRNIYKGD